ncbi:hypothetical protein LOAG_12637 [Loa loa]|uniref:Uncharacterized protein n=1 Tax=Loa loa TaxID=7209 RepID=A0A1S0TLY1_LOALO|nr:hypothetical protein LOAG_12637 [Loa loa]EFO15873.1 hypothetical protein LOAG_12637 [Loa loa]
MGSDTVSHQDYVNRTGERYPVTKPQDSDLLHGDGSFMSETQTATEFTAKKGERYDAKRPVESELWKREGWMGFDTASHRRMRQLFKTFIVSYLLV